MPTSFNQAYRAMLELFRERWASGTTSIVSYVPEVYYQQESLNVDVRNTRYFASVFIKNNSSRQRGFRNSQGSRLYTTNGDVNINIFCPRVDNQFYNRGVLLAELARGSYRGRTASGGIWFREFYINDLGNRETGFYVFNVNGLYEYDEVV